MPQTAETVVVVVVVVVVAPKGQRRGFLCLSVFLPTFEAANEYPEKGMNVLECVRLIRAAAADFVHFLGVYCSSRTLSQ